MAETMADSLRERVRERYAAAATMVTSGHGRTSCTEEVSCCADSGACCGPTVEVDETFGSASTPLASVPVCPSLP
jgi:hypothetical protein